MRNMRLFKRLLLLLLLGVLPGTSRDAWALDGTLLVANREGGSVSFIDLSLGVEIARIPIGAAIPHEVAISQDGRLALTGEYGTDAAPGRHLVLMDIASARILARIDLGPRSRPHSMEFLHDNQRAVVTMQDSDQIALVDVQDMKVLRVYPTGGREGHMVRLSADNTRAYVTSRGDAGTLSIIYLDEDRPPLLIPTGKGAEGLALTPDGEEIWVINRLAATISIVNAAKLEIVQTLAAHPQAGRAEISAAGRVVVPNGTFSDSVVQYLRVYDRKTRGVLRDIPLRDGQNGDGSFGILILGEFVFVSDRDQRKIEIYDLDKGGPGQVLIQNQEQPDGMAWSPLRVNVFSQ